MGVVNLRSFELNLEKALEGFEGSASDLKRHVALDLLTRVVERTPVDTGRARANWQVSINGPTTAPIRYTRASHIAAERNERSVYNQTVEQGSEVIETVQEGESIWLTNNLPYIEVLEQGDHSKQNTEGIVAISVAEVAEGLTRT
jgi:hypothetical protein